jgi:hypothetical protein
MLQEPRPQLFNSFLDIRREFQERMGEIVAALAAKNLCGLLFHCREYSTLFNVLEMVHFHVFN